MSVQEIIDIIEKVAPLSQQEVWDNSGLQIGQRDANVSSALLCTDVTDAVVDEAIAKGCEMIVSHHPLLFTGLKKLEGTTRPERCAIKAIRAGICIYSSHTAMDSYLHGVSGHMAERMGMTDYRILAGEETGLGVIGNLPEAMPLNQFLNLVKTAFAAPVIRYTEGEKNIISKVALCGGAGAEFTEEAIRQGADAYVSADFKYHEFQQADGRISIVDIGHFESEQYTKEVFEELLKNAGIRVIMAESDISPVKIF